ncbi:[acyl-carrier-protein] S-malonyltransferase [Balneicella halophila]|uniref:Malonyl CoA-acyl carrier protein transacylase n=1 Tax=Balneicella halophila TaxID=1537566 RepID=A0A7L4UQB9_BALHA|nr:ACP S-malonyltransferase [Balneicella halophila]PVX51869.1 [acyl-carrier-protein] S-malonyltransferase [Balneicella halophila]
MKAFVFPGQGAQHVGMGQDLYEASPKIKELFNRANEVLGFSITDLMFHGTEENLKETKVTQPAIFLHSVLLTEYLGEQFKPAMVAGHSLGEFSALVATKAMSFEDGLTLVSKRANAMQEACDITPSTMAAIVGLADEIVEKVCTETDGVVVPANYNCPGQLVISGEIDAVKKACEALKEKGAKRALILKVGGAFHSPLMEPAHEKLAQAIEKTEIHEPICPIYQNVDAKAHTDAKTIKENLIAQLTSPVYWTQTVQNMVADGATSFTEVGPGKALQGMIRKVDNSLEITGIEKI